MFLMILNVKSFIIIRCLNAKCCLKRFCYHKWIDYVKI